MCQNMGANVLLLSPELCDFTGGGGIFALCRSPGEEGGEIIHMGNAIMSFYSALIDLLGRCAPEMHVRLSMATVTG